MSESPETAMTPEDWHWGPDPAFGNLCKHKGSRENCSGPDCGPRHNVPTELVVTLGQRLYDDWHEGCDENGCNGASLNQAEEVAAEYLELVLPAHEAMVTERYDRAVRAEVVEWIEAQQLKCPRGHDPDSGRKAMCCWCWHNAASRGAARLAGGTSGPTPAMVTARIARGECP